MDTDQLAAWLDAEGLEVGRPIAYEQIVGGRSNVMFRLTRGDARWVLRRPAKIAIERANEGMRREFRILAALAGSGVPHPEVVRLCDDPDVLGCTFYLMQQVDGVHPLPPPAALDTVSGREGIAYAMVDALARLHQVDWRAAGLADLGRPERFHERQVSRWSTQLASYEGRALEGIDAVMAWLGEHAPADYTPTIMHADYHMLNLLVGADEPARVTAVLDWETATIGDPLLDLAGFLEVWTSAAREGWPPRAALIDRYRATRGVEVGDLTYYEVLYHFRLAVLLEGIYTRSLRDPTRPDADDMGAMVLSEVAKAVARIG